MWAEEWHIYKTVVVNGITRKSFIGLKETDWCSVRIGRKWGFIDNKNRIVIPPQFDHALGFQGALARVMIRERVNKPRHCWGLINTSGTFIVSCKYDNICSFSEGMAAVALNGKWGYINDSGDLIVDPRFDDVLSFVNGTAIVKSNSKVGYVNKEGSLFIKCSFSNADYFSEGLAAVQVRKRWGFIDMKGKMVIAPQYDGPAKFWNNHAIVDINETTVLIDKSGRQVLRCAELDADNKFNTSFKKALFKKGDKVFIADKYGISEGSVENSGESSFPRKKYNRDLACNIADFMAGNVNPAYDIGRPFKYLIISIDTIDISHTTIQSPIVIFKNSKTTLKSSLTAVIKGNEKAGRSFLILCGQ